MRTISRSLSNRNSAIDLASAVLPTPVGPRNKKEPNGLDPACRPARDTRTAFDTASTASRCPTTDCSSTSSIRRSRSRSPVPSFDSGMPVDRDTTSLIASSVTVSLTSASVSSPSAGVAATAASSAGMVEWTSSPALEKSPIRSASSRSFLACSSFTDDSLRSLNLRCSSNHLLVRACDSALASATCRSISSRRFTDAGSRSFLSASSSMRMRKICRSMFSSASGLDSCSRRRRDAASSTRSIALSGRKRSVM
mmetsp:Transcript_4609/g.14938  ORF Transcript_4609/g.14938 Transcript_4609/m.14938 type:complete len:253 (+) Transcript_4609:718-1476(+)